MIWRNFWLPPSETFILNQAQALKQWSPSFAGLGRVSPSLDLADQSVQTFPRSQFTMAINRRGYGLRRVSRAAVAAVEQVDVVHAHFGPDAAYVVRAATLA